MAKILVAVVKCDVCDHVWEIFTAKPQVRCPKCGFVQAVTLEHERVGTAFLKLRG